jgi:hypothetical protein
MRLLPLLLLTGIVATPLAAQSPGQLSAFFEGRSVRVKIEMPGAEQGVDVYPGLAPPIDFPDMATRLKRFGTALRRGDEVLVTKVKVKSNLIEFQLGGGGYGTSGDDASTSIYVPSAPKTDREKNLERDIKLTNDPAQRRAKGEELDALRTARQREDAHNQAEATVAQQAKEANVRQRRAEGGSRFNLRYRPNVPNEAMTPQSVMAALAEYVDFSGIAGEGPAAPATPAMPMAGPAGGGLRKGMTADDADAMFGRPESISQRKEGTLTVSTSLYRTRDQRISAEFVEGVLIRYTITSP